MATDKLAKQTDVVALAISAEDMEAVKDAMAVNGEDMGVFDFPEISIPAGGGLSFEVPTLEGSDAQKTLTGVMLVAQNVRQYYAEEFSGGGTPPDCASHDAKTGIGTPGGDCATCHLAQWGSAKNNGQACSQRRQVLLLMEGSALPYFINVPPSSLKPLKEYMNKLTGAGKAFFSVVTRISLTKAQSTDGIAYSQCVFEFVGPLSPDQAELAASYRSTLVALMAARATQAPQQPVNAFDVDEYTTEPVPVS